MITDKQVIQRLKEYEQVFSPAFRYISAELAAPNPSIDKIEVLLDDNDAQLAFLDFADLVSDIQSTKKKLFKNQALKTRVQSKTIEPTDTKLSEKEG